MEQPFADCVEDLALRLCHNAGRRHLNVSLVDSIQVLTNWRDDLGVRHGSVETGLHDGASSEYANSSQAKLLDGPADFRNHVDHWQRRRGLEVGDAEVTGNGCDRDTSGASGRKALGEPHIDGNLSCCIVPREIAKERRRIGVDDRQI
jgi:hypothetical protein